MNRLFQVFLLSAFPSLLGGPVFAMASDAALKLAADIASICETWMPNSGQVEEQIEKLGFETDRWNGRFHVLLDPSKNISVVVSGPDTYDKHCAILVQGMTTDQARDLVQPWLESSQASVAEIGQSKADTVWGGSKEGFLTKIAVFSTSHDERIDGAWIRMVITDKPI